MRAHVHHAGDRSEAAAAIRATETSLLRQDRVGPAEGGAGAGPPGTGTGAGKRPGGGGKGGAGGGGDPRRQLIDQQQRVEACKGKVGVCRDGGLGRGLARGECCEGITGCLFKL